MPSPLLSLPNARSSFTIFYLYVYNFFDSISLPPLNTSLDPKSRGAARGHMPMTPVCTSISRVLSRWWNITTTKKKKTQKQDNGHNIRRENCYDIKCIQKKSFFINFSKFNIFRTFSNQPFLISYKITKIIVQYNYRYVTYYNHNVR